MKLKDGFMLYDAGEEHLVVATGQAAKVFTGMIRNNETAQSIFRELLKETTEEKIVSALVQEYDVTPEKAAVSVRKIVAQCREAGFLDE